MRTMTTPVAGTRTLAATMLLLALGACGSETSEPGGEGDAGFDASTATLTDAPFCDRLDTSMVAELLQLPADKVRTQVDREVGEKFQGSAEPEGPSESVANLCVLGSGTSQLVVSVQPDATSSDVRETVDDLASLAGKASSETCTSGDAEGFGEPAGFFTCESEPPVRVRVVATGLVGDSKFYCAAIVNQGGGPELAESTRTACRTVLQELAES